jgi:predicted P-loop ATPase
MRWDGSVVIYAGASRRSVFWQKENLEWSAFVERLRTPVRTAETVDEFKALPRPQQQDIKDVGGFVGGILKDKRRKNTSVAARSLITLDMDYITAKALPSPANTKELPAILPNPSEERPNPLKMLAYIRERIRELSVASVVYSTHSHRVSSEKEEIARDVDSEKEEAYSPQTGAAESADSTKDNPRLRLIIPLANTVSPDAYEAIARKIAETVGIEFFDDTTYEAARLMFWPSVPKDAQYLFWEHDAPWLDPDEWLAKYKNWRDTTSWPRSSRQAKGIERRVKTQGDPRAKKGVIGAFCRVYSIPDAIEKYLSDIYEPIGLNRYTYTPGEGVAGVVIYDGGAFAYSHHGTDPAGLRLCNAFDLVRIHKFGNADEAAGIKSMAKMLEADEAVKAELFKERVGMFDDDDDWKSGLEVDKRGVIKPNFKNLTLIFDNDPTLSLIAYNMHRECLAFTAKPEWAPRKFPNFSNADLAHLRVYIAKRYGIESREKIKDAFEISADKRRFHPIKAYLEALPEWDGLPRAQTLLIDYLGARDDAYVRAVTLKTLTAAVTRVYNPGVKFDYVLVLNGPQAIGKSTLFRRLAGPAWYNDGLTLTDMQHLKDGAEKLQGYWILEISELAGLKRADIETVKSFISRENDKYRPSYGEVVEDHPRQCVMIATVNGMDGFLRDVTGNRRFWPVTVPGGQKRKPWNITEYETAQIWAETLKAYRSGERLYLEGAVQETAMAEQVKALEEDPREGLIASFLDRLLPENWDDLDIYKRRAFMRGDDAFLPLTGIVKRDSVSTLEIWCECFGNDAARMEKRDSYLIAAMLLKLGWQRTGALKRRPIYGVQRIWTPE